MSSSIEALLFAVGSEGLSLDELVTILESDNEKVLKEIE